MCERGRVPENVSLDLTFFGCGTDPERFMLQSIVSDFSSSARVVSSMVLDCATSQASATCVF